MFSGYDFVYDGKSSISENVKLLYTDGNAFEDVKGIPDREITTFHTNQSSKWNITGVKIDSPLEFSVQIMLHGEGEEEYKKINPTLARNQTSRITHWLFDNVQFKKLQILTEDMRDLYFMAVFKDIEYCLSGGEIIGFKATVLCDTIGAYEEKSITKSCSGTTKFTIQCQQSSIYEIKPIYEIEVLSNEFSIKVNFEEMKFKNLTIGSKVTIDADTLITKSSANENLYVGDKFNKVFPVMLWGNNNITVTGKCKLKINYKMIREVGC